jgi:hypothetical protein
MDIPLGRFKTRLGCDKMPGCFRTSMCRFQDGADADVQHVCATLTRPMV